MKKSDLKTGMWIIDNDSDKYQILLNTKHGDIYITTYGRWGDLKDINDDLTSKHNEGLDIIKIFQPATANYYYRCRDEDIIWEYKKEDITNEDYLKLELENLEKEFSELYQEGWDFYQQGCKMKEIHKRIKEINERQN